MPRYIDADKLPITTVAVQPYAISEKPYNAEVVFARFVRNAPTADVRENVHGEWIRSDWNGANIRYTCSRCQLSIVSNEDYIRKHRFCFACGADMRGEE